MPAGPAAQRIDAVQARRNEAGLPFSVVADQLAAARRPHDLVRHATALHAIEKALSR